jgi:FkbM family methyltransferase
MPPIGRLRIIDERAPGCTNTVGFPAAPASSFFVIRFRTAMRFRHATNIRGLAQRSVKYVLGRLGYEIRRSSKFPGSNVMKDVLLLTRIAGGTARPVVFDVGANIGNLTRQFHQTLGNPFIHAFEPGPESFLQLQANCSDIPDVILNNWGVGAQKEELQFRENQHSVMSSFLEPGPDHWGTISRQLKVPICTVDGYCQENSINRIDILKSDTQGYDLEVFHGAKRMIDEGRIRLILTEIIFSQIYDGQPELDEIYRYLHDRNFRLVSFYGLEYQENLLGWLDALFIHTDGRSPRSTL